MGRGSVQLSLIINFEVVTGKQRGGYQSILPSGYLLHSELENPHAIKNGKPSINRPLAIFHGYAK